jgi:serine/threonine protein kinase
MEYVEGENAKDKLGFDNWKTKKHSWPHAAALLSRYVLAEMDLLSRGIFYRDLNLERILFTDEKAVLIDLEAAVAGEPEGPWQFEDRRGTWETMAPEEFPGFGELTTRAATYRAAVFAYLAFAGRLPFPRFPLRSQVYAWRKQHIASVAPELPGPVGSVFNSALQREPARRHKTT